MTLVMRYNNPLKRLARELLGLRPCGCGCDVVYIYGKGSKLFPDLNRVQQWATRDPDGHA